MRVTDYLVIGAGAASMSFVDTIVTECPDATVTIVDRHQAPGGHWNDAYDYVHLHQPSLLYGVASEQLEGNWLKLVLTKATLPWHHRASKAALLVHYNMLMKKWVANGTVQYFPNCKYDFSKKPSANDEDKVHTFQKLDESQSYEIRVREKLVNGISGECRVPSKYPLEFSVDDSVTVKTPNQLFKEAADFKQGQGWFSRDKTKISPKKYVVLGCGKTAMDAVFFLQREMGVPADSISWVMPNDVWMLRREGPGTPSSWPEALLRNDMDVHKAMLMLERDGVFTRIDEKVIPTKYRFPVVGAEELGYLRRVENMIRQGRMTDIAKSNNGELLSATFQKGDPIDFSPDTVFVHCASPGPFNGNKIGDLFPSPKEMNLSLLFAPPVPISMSCLAVLEGRRRKGLLDLDFGRKLLAGNNEELSEHEIINGLIRKYDLADDVTSNPAGQVDSLTTVAKFIALFDKEDPKKGLSWLSSNRLSMLSIPGAKGKAYETVELMLSKKHVLQLSETDVNQLNALEERLAPLQGM
jgi:hypothetical protein